jgi:hypothetical protein
MNKKSLILGSACLFFCSSLVFAEAMPIKKAPKAEFKTEIKVVLESMQGPIAEVTADKINTKNLEFPANLDGWSCLLYPIKETNGFNNSTVICHTTGDNLHYVFLGIGCPSASEAENSNGMALMFKGTVPALVTVSIMCNTVQK